MYTLIRSEAEYQRAIERIELIFDAKPNTPEGEELELLSVLIEHYELVYKIAFARVQLVAS